MATLTKVLLCSASDPGAWTSSTGSATTATEGLTGDSDTVSGHTDTTCLEQKIAGKNKSNSGNYWTWAGTWENLGVPVGATVTQVNLITDWHCKTYTTGASSQVGPEALYDSSDTLQATFLAGSAFSATGSWATRTGTAQSVPSALQASGSTVHLRLSNNLATGSSTSAVVALHQTYVQVVITYTPPTVTGAAALSAAATMTAAGFQTAHGAVAASASATATAAGVRTRFGAASGAASASLSASGGRTAFGSSTPAAAASLSASGTVSGGFNTVTGAAALTGSASLTAAGRQTSYGNASLAASASFSAAGTRTVSGTCSLATVASMAATGTRERFGAATMTASSTMAAAGVAARTGAAALTASVSLTVGSGEPPGLCWIGSRSMTGVGR